MATPAKKSWAVLAYTIAEDAASSSRLDTSAEGELKAICDAADFRHMSVAAQVDFKRRRGIYRSALTEIPPAERGFDDIDPEGHPLWGGILRRRRLRHDRRPCCSAKPRISNAADADVLQTFLRFGQAECPADRYVISFFGHAAGPLGVFSDSVPGDALHDTLRLPALVNAFKGCENRAAVVVFRDCFMNCLEAIYQLRDSTEFIVATQALAPAVGTWPWKAFMASLTPEASAYEAGLGLTKALAAYLDDPAHRSGFDAVPYTLIDTSAAGQVATGLSAVVEALEAARQDPARARACAKALEASRVGSPESAKVPGDPALLDVPTMCGRLAALKGDPVAAAAVALGRVVGSRLVRWHHSQTRNHLGTSLFYKPVRPDDLHRSYLQAEDETVARRRRRALSRAGAVEGHRMAPDRARSAAGRRLTASASWLSSLRPSWRPSSWRARRRACRPFRWACRPSASLGAPVCGRT